MIETSLQTEPVSLPGRPFGLIARSVAGWALLLAFVILSPMFVFLPAALFQCGIRHGRGVAWAALLVGALLAFGVFGISELASPSTQQTNALPYLMAELFALAVPAMLVLPLVERSADFGRVLMSAVLLSFAGLLATEYSSHLLLGFSPYAQQVHTVQTQIADMYQKAGVPEVWSNRVLKIGISCLPAILLSEIIVVFVLSLVMLGRLRAFREFVYRRETSVSPAGSAYRFRNLSLPEWLLFAFLAGGITPLASGMWQKVAANILAVVSFLYLLQGLAIFRALLSAIGAGALGLIVAGVMVALFSPISELLLSIAGLFDSFFDFRKFKRKDHSDESHTD